MLKQFKTVIDRLILPKYPQIIEYDIDVAGDVELVYFVMYALKNNVDGNGFLLYSSSKIESELRTETKSLFKMCSPEHDSSIQVYFNYRIV
jgi:hypothetical protein